MPAENCTGQSRLVALEVLVVLVVLAKEASTEISWHVPSQLIVVKVDGPYHPIRLFQIELGDTERRTQVQRYEGRTI